MAAKFKSVLDGHWNLDAFDTRCACGAEVSMLRRGNMTMIPAGHTCSNAEHQRGVMRTIRIEEQAGLHVSPSEAARRLNEALRP